MQSSYALVARSPWPFIKNQNVSYINQTKNMSVEKKQAKDSLIETNSPAQVSNPWAHKLEDNRKKNTSLM